MTTLRQIIIDGLREAGIIAVGDTPDADQHDEGLRRLQNLISSVYGNEFGEPLININYGTAGLTNAFGLAEDNASAIDSVYVPANTRVIFNISSATTVYLPPNPQDGARVAVLDNVGNFSTANVTLNANGRLIENASTVVLNTNLLNREWFYRADTGNWVRVTALIADSQMPFPTEFDDLFITLLAFRLNPRYGAETGQELVSVLSDMRKRFRARYYQTREMPSEDGITILPLNPYSRNFLTF